MADREPTPMSLAEYNSAVLPAGCPVSAPDYSIGLEELAGLITFRVGAWHDFGYAEPPAPECKAIPPLGERSAEAIRAGHEAIEAIDELTRQLYALRDQLITELRQNEDINMARSGALLARLRAERDAAAVHEPAAEDQADPHYDIDAARAAGDDWYPGSEREVNQ